MSLPNKSLEKSKRFAGVKANDFGNKTRANDTNRSAVRPQGWANLGKINSRRVPPPANLPSLKSETGVNSPTFDPPSTPSHGWTSNETPTPSSAPPYPTQQQLDSMPVSSSTPPPQLSSQPSSADADKSRAPPTWSSITAGSNTTPMEPTPNLLAPNEFPRLATTPDRKSQPESPVNPTFRPANLATWKEGGGSRVQPTVNDVPPMIPNHPGANFYQQPMPNVRMYPPQMWAYNPYPPMPVAMHPSQRMNNLNEYKSPTILRHKDIDDLSKITDNTWSTATQEVNYEEKIRFSDDEDDHQRRDVPDSNNKSRRMKPQILQHPRLIDDDEHVKQMQDSKNSELINALAMAKQRREEQERHLRNEQMNVSFDEQKPIPGYQTRPLLTANDQENHPTSRQQSMRETANAPRTRHDTANSQSSFTMKSWSDQMDSFNYTPSPEKSGGRANNADHYNHTGSRSPSPYEKEPASRKSKRLPLSSKKPPRTNLTQTKPPTTKKPAAIDSSDRYDVSNDQWETWEETADNRQPQYTNDARRRHPQPSDDPSTQKPNRFNKQPSAKARNGDRQPAAGDSRFKSNPPTTNKPNPMSENKSANNKNQPAWRPPSPPNRAADSLDPNAQDSAAYKTQPGGNDRRPTEFYSQRTNPNDHKQRYPPMSTASIPPLMSVRSDVPPTSTAKMYPTGASHYDDENAYYDSNLQTHSRYQQSHLHSRGYTTLGSYGRYRRSGAVRHQQQYATYHAGNTSGGASSAPATSNGARSKKNSAPRTNGAEKKTNNQPVDSTKPVATSDTAPLIEKQSTPVETPVLSPSVEMPNKEIGKPVESNNGTSESKSATKQDTEGQPVGPNEVESSVKSNKKNTSTTTTSAKRRTNKDAQAQQYEQRYQNQPPRHRNNYARSMQEYEAMQMTDPHNYYGAARRAAPNGRNSHMHDLSSNYYYEHPQQHYHNRYNYSNEHYQARSTNKHSKRTGTSSANNRRQQHQQQQPPHAVNGSSTNASNNNFRHHSTSDNDQKEGEEWETASESSTNMRNGHHDNAGVHNQSANDSKGAHRGRTPPKKSFSSQRPHARQIFKYTNA